MCSREVNKPLDDIQIRELLAKAKEAAGFAYAPYSRLRVGAAVLTNDGRIFTGANVENSSFPVSICAERVAIFKAVSEGVRGFRALAVVCSNHPRCVPCGACRQVMYEFSPDLLVITESPQGHDCLYLRDLLPLGFHLEAPAE